MNYLTQSHFSVTDRKVLIAGASGLVGQSLLQGLLGDTSVMEVHVLSRRVLDIQNPKVTVHVIDFDALPALPTVGEVYLAVGTTIKQAGSQAAFRHIDRDINLAVAQAALAAGARKIALVSAIGADSKSKVFYNRVKGELEDALSKLAVETLVIAQPSLLLGDRKRMGQPRRAGEKIGEIIFGLLGPLITKKYHPIDAARVAGAMLAAMRTAQGRIILSSEAMQAFAH